METFNWKWFIRSRLFVEILKSLPPHFTLFVMVAGQYIADRLYVTRLLFLQSERETAEAEAVSS